MLQQEALDILRIELIPKTYLLTPNLPEAAALCGFPVRTEQEMEDAARRLQEMGARNVLIKGGHLETDAVDLLLTDKQLHRLPAKRIDTQNTHGTGCTFESGQSLAGSPVISPGITCRRRIYLSGNTLKQPSAGTFPRHELQTFCFQRHPASLRQEP
ncbi:MAG: PfkB family carbohydrate kinase [Desulfuromonadaceae bacterium]